jgi:hypothetical protein
VDGVLDLGVGGAVQLRDLGVLSFELRASSFEDDPRSHLVRRAPVPGITSFLITDD